MLCGVLHYDSGSRHCDEGSIKILQILRHITIFTSVTCAMVFESELLLPGPPPPPPPDWIHH